MKEFNSVLKNQMVIYIEWHQDKYNDPKSDSLSKVQGKLDDVKGVMVDNIGIYQCNCLDKIMENHEKVSTVVNRSDELLVTSSISFGFYIYFINEKCI